MAARRSRCTRQAGAALAAGLLVAGGCSTSADTATDEQRLVEAVLVGGSADENSIRFAEPDARCAAGRIVDEIPTERLRELGLDVGEGTGPELSQPPLTETEGDIVFAALDGCTDLVEQVGQALSRDAQLPTDRAECVAGRYRDSGVLRDSLLAAEFDPGLNERIDATILEAIAACQAD
ncbi:MAG: hypothetical protein Q8K58_12910 [Acidimicrobiales bacterium]|nr:hypothetical protein [Acidimicrobiales bacterium]